MGIFLINISVVSAESLSAELSKTEITIGHETVLTVNLNEADAFRGMQFEIAYDENVLECIGIEKSDIFNQAFVGDMNSDDAGKVKVLLAFAEPVDYDGEVCKITFKVTGSSGNKALSFENIKISLEEPVTEEDFEIPFSTKGKSNTSGGSLAGGNKAQSTVTPPSAGDEKNSGTESDSESEDENSSGDEALEEDSEAAEAKEYDFDDISEHWARESIITLARQEIVTGMADGSFQPEGYVTRAQMAVMLANALALEETGENSFEDVPEGSWYFEPVAKCAAVGLISGFENKFRPDDTITRQEMAVMLTKAARYLELEEKEEKIEFSDEADIADWAAEYVSYASRMKLMSGMGDGTFLPEGTVTRAQATVAVLNLCKGFWEL